MRIISALLVRLFLALWILAGIGAPALARDSAEAGTLRPLPWHLVDYRHALPGDSRTGLAFETLAVTVELQGQARKGDFFYLAALWGKIDGNGFYFGLQTDLHDGGQRPTGGKQSGRFQGPGLIFSRWGNSDPFNARPPADGWVVVPGPNTPYEGQTLSLRRPFDWQAGRYRFELHSSPAEPPLRGVWLSLRVRPVSAPDSWTPDSWTDGGSLYFPTVVPRPHLDLHPVTFAEIYGRASSTISLESLASTLPRRALTLFPLELDGKVYPPDGKASTPTGVPGYVNSTPLAADRTVRLNLLP